MSKHQRALNEAHEEWLAARIRVRDRISDMRGLLGSYGSERNPLSAYPHTAPGFDHESAKQKLLKLIATAERTIYLIGKTERLEREYVAAHKRVAEDEAFSE